MRKTEDEMPPTIGDRQDGGRAGGRLYAMSGLPQEAGGSRLDEGQKSSARGRDSQQRRRSSTGGQEKIRCLARWERRQVCTSAKTNHEEIMYLAQSTGRWMGVDARTREDEIPPAIGTADGCEIDCKP